MPIADNGILHGSFVVAAARKRQSHSKDRKLLLALDIGSRFHDPVSSIIFGGQRQLHEYLLKLQKKFNILISIIYHTYHYLHAQRLAFTAASRFSLSF